MEAEELRKGYEKADRATRIKSMVAMFKISSKASELALALHGYDFKDLESVHILF